MSLNYVAIFVATVLQFIFGAVWYSALFGKLWGQIHGFDKLSKEVQKRMMSEMGPYYAIQFLVTIVTTTVFAIFVEYVPQDWNPYGLAFFFWIGFIVPTQVSAVIFGGTPKEWIMKKIAVQSGAAFACLQIAAAVLYYL